MKMLNGIMICLLLASSTFVRAAADYEEVSYDDLVNQINKRKSSITQSANDPLDQLKLHAGFGLISSANNVNTGGGQSSLKYQNGFQMSLGIDLFSPHWAAETTLRNFGQARSGTETRSLREFDLKLMHRDLFSNFVGYRLGAGLGNRFLKVSDDANEISIDDNTPTAVLFGGLEAYIKKNISVGVETGLRSSMVNQTADRSSMDVTLRLDTYF